MCSFYHILKVADKFRVVSLFPFSPIITSRNIRLSLPNIKPKGVCPLEEWTLLWLWLIGCLTSSSCSSSVISCTLVSLFWTSSASPPPSVSFISTLWSHSPWCTNSPTWTISTKQDRYSCLPGLFTTSLGRSSLAPTSTIFFLLCLWPYQTPLTPPYSTLVVPIAGPYPHHKEHSLTPPQLGFPRAFFLPSLVRL